MNKKTVNLMNFPKITKIKHTIEPTWDSKTGRNSNSGKFSGTFVGWFDTLEINVGKTTQSELTQIRNQVEVPIIENVQFLDSKTGNNKIENFYGTAIGVEITNIHMSDNKKTYPPFTFSLKAVERRKDM